MIEIDLESLYAASRNADATYAPISRYPGSERDIALLVDAVVTSAQVEAVINRNKLVTSAAPFDIYTGGGVPAGKKSVAYRVSFPSDRSTLTGEFVDKARESIVRQLERELGAEQRG